MQPELRVRRARRDDFERVQVLLGIEAPATRGARKRFRRLVSTLREDCYLAERDDGASLAGVAVIAYARGLGPATAIVRALHGSSDAAALLLDCARRRALARGCTRLELQLDRDATPAPAALAETLERDGWTDGGRILQRAVSP